MGFLEADGGALALLPQAEAQPERIARVLNGLISDPAKCATMAAAMQTLYLDDAAKRIAAEVVQVG